MDHPVSCYISRIKHFKYNIHVQYLQLGQEKKINSLECRRLFTMNNTVYCIAVFVCAT